MKGGCTASSCLLFWLELTALVAPGAFGHRGCWSSEQGLVSPARVWAAASPSAWLLASKAFVLGFLRRFHTLSTVFVLKELLTQEVSPGSKPNAVQFLSFSCTRVNWSGWFGALHLGAALGAVVVMYPSSGCG